MDLFYAQINRVVDAITPNKEIVKETVMHSNNVEECLVRIEKSSENVHGEIDSIMQLVSEQQQFVSNFEGEMNSLYDVFNELIKSTEDVYTSVAKHNKSTTRLQNMNISLQKVVTSLDEFNKKIGSESTLNKMSECKEMAQDVVKLIIDEIIIKNSIDDLLGIKCKDILDKFLSEYKFIEAIWVNETMGEFVYSNPPAGIVNAKVRTWFKREYEG